MASNDDKTSCESELVNSCHHADQVVLPNGASVRAASLRDAIDTSVVPPDFGVYLDPTWEPSWPHTHLDWPDFGLPVDPAAAEEQLLEALSMARDSSVVEIGCIGGHGRTGTALAMLAVLAGLTSDPVLWVRETYCQRAIETEEQADFVRAWASDR